MGRPRGAVAIDGNSVYIANQMTASVTVADLASGAIVKTFSVDPCPMALAVSTAENQSLVLAEETGTLGVVDLASYGIPTRINAGDTERYRQFTMPVISSITPSITPVGSTFTLTMQGPVTGHSNDRVRCHGKRMSADMMGGGPGSGPASRTRTSRARNSAGTQITAFIQILPAIAIGARQVRLPTNYGAAMGMITNSLCNVTK